MLAEVPRLQRPEGEGPAREDGRRTPRAEVRKAHGDVNGGAVVTFFMWAIAGEAFVRTLLRRYEDRCGEQGAADTTTDAMVSMFAREMVQFSEEVFDDDKLRRINPYTVGLSSARLVFLQQRAMVSAVARVVAGTGCVWQSLCNSYSVVSPGGRKEGGA
jgi:hypothetical protein